MLRIYYVGAEETARRCFGLLSTIEYFAINELDLQPDESYNDREAQWKKGGAQYKLLEETRSATLADLVQQILAQHEKKNASLTPIQQYKFEVVFLHYSKMLSPYLTTAKNSIVRAHQQELLHWRWEHNITICPRRDLTIREQRKLGLAVRRSLAARVPK